jgi:hypothetical protein
MKWRHCEKIHTKSRYTVVDGVFPDANRVTNNTFCVLSKARWPFSCGEIVAHSALFSSVEPPVSRPRNTAEKGDRKACCFVGNLQRDPKDCLLQLSGKFFMWLESPLPHGYRCN